MTGIAIMHNTIQEYGWGSKSFIPDLMGNPAKKDKPQAELWMGAHPKAPSRIVQDGVERSLIDIVNDSPDQILGYSAAKYFEGSFPFLFKILAIDRPLSIQAHPDKNQAVRGFTLENKKKIPLDAARRNYRDPNHKPELLCALKPLHALKGFRKTDNILDLFSRLGNLPPELKIDILRDRPDSQGIKTFFLSLLNMKSSHQKQVINEVTMKAQRIESSDPAFQWVIRLQKAYPDNIGSLSPLFMNLVVLQPEEAIFVTAGELHAYLEGAGLEVMANSDNVLRGGLTDKNIDIPELIRILNFDSCAVNIIKPIKTGQYEYTYPVEIKEFRLSKITLKKGDYYRSMDERSVEILICLHGNGLIMDRDRNDLIEISKGVSVIIPASVKNYELRGNMTLYKTFVPPVPVSWRPV